jgi:hypothetical protein
MSMKKFKCSKCQDKRVVLIKRSSVPHGDYYEVCKCQLKNERTKMHPVRRIVRPGIPKR